MLGKILQKGKFTIIKKEKLSELLIILRSVFRIVERCILDFYFKKKKKRERERGENK